MSRTIVICTAAAFIAAAGGGFVVAQRPLARTVAFITAAGAQETSAPIYYRDPDGKPTYSLTPKKNASGRDYSAVLAGADISFENVAEAMPTSDTRPAGTGGSRKIKFYRNPMGLPDTSPTPKKDSMGMDYIPVFDGDDSDDGTVKLSPGKIQRSGVKSEPATRRVIRTMIRAPGTIQLDERRISVISMRAESWVQKVADVTTGTKVRNGQPLMDIYSPAISSAAAEYVATINSKMTGGDGPYGRGSRQQIINLDVPETVIAEMEKSRIVPISIAWTAPRDGIVLERNAIEGMRAQPGDILFRIADTSVVWALVDVAERDLGAIAVGQPVQIRTRGLSGRHFAGKINVIYPQVNRETRTARVRIELANTDLALLPDMYIDASIETGNADPVVSVPESAVIDTGSRQSVFIDKGDGRFEPRGVKLGRRGGGYVEVHEGVSDGEPVVISANFLIDAESNLKAALKGFSEAEGSQ